MKSSGFIAVVAILLLPSLGVAEDKPAAPVAIPAPAKPVLSPAQKGKAIATDRNKGNCLACHMMGDGESPGNFGPPLSQMKERYPDKAVLRKQIWDATIKNPKSIMPPFGKHGIMSETEIDQVIDYLYTL
jgi:sulfur-oxidizing protein SoxX